MDILGELAAVAASLCFSVGSTMFTLSGRRYGAILPTRGGLVIALVLIMALHWLMTGSPLPGAEIESERWLYLGISGVIGFGIGFYSIMNAFMRIGPRLALLIAAFGPVLSTILGYLFLDEVLAPQSIFGIALTISGIVFVVSESKKDAQGEKVRRERTYWVGVLFALLGALGQSLSFVLTSLGAEGDFDPITASLIRLITGSITIWVLAMLQGEIRKSFRTLRQYPRALAQMTTGAALGPFLGALLVVIAVQHAPVGIASTLANLTPIFLIPIGYFVFGERISQRAIIGTVIAVSGTALLFL